MGCPRHRHGHSRNGRRGRHQGGDRPEDRADPLMARRSWRCSRRAADVGSATLEIVVLFPAVLLATFGLVQGALYYHARDVALAAANDGLTAARSRAGTAEGGRNAALTFLRRAGGDHVLPASLVKS